MQLDLEQLRTVTTGAVSVTEEKDGFHFHRFTAAQEAYYAPTPFQPKCLSTAGVRLEFVTDSASLYLRVNTASASTRQFFMVDIYCDGAPYDAFGNTNTAGEKLDAAGNPVVRDEYLLGVFEHSCRLPEGSKRVCIYLPCLVLSVVQELRLDDGATLVPVRHRKTMLQFGDSITHGYDARHPALTYTARLTDALGVEAFNKAIGGEKFCPGLAKLRDDVDPDYITVAYGTNDWSKYDRETFVSLCTDFYAALSAQYPAARIFAITPIWRKDRDKDSMVGTFDELSVLIGDAVHALPNVTLIEGYPFVPQEEKWFGDRRLHPNDAGFEHYFRHLFAALLPYLGEEN